MFHQLEKKNNLDSFIKNQGFDVEEDLRKAFKLVF